MFNINVLVILLLLWPSTSSANLADDEKQCADQLQNLAECIPYVSGSAPKPTPGCCTDAEKVRSSNPKCLCVLIIQSTDTSMGLPINTTLAFHMPAACNSDAKISDCPSILKLSPDDPNAKIFKDPSDNSSNSTTPASSSSATTPASSSSSDTTTPPSTDGSSSKAAPTNKAGKLGASMGVAISMVSVIIAAIIFM